MIKVKIIKLYRTNFLSILFSLFLIISILQFSTSFKLKLFNSSISSLTFDGITLFFSPLFFELLFSAEIDALFPISLHAFNILSGILKGS